MIDYYHSKSSIKHSKRIIYGLNYVITLDSWSTWEINFVLQVTIKIKFRLFSHVFLAKWDELTTYTSTYKLVNSMCLVFFLSGKIYPDQKVYEFKLTPLNERIEYMKWMGWK